MPAALPNPVPLTDPDPENITVEEYEKIKNADCAFYKDCLSLAAKENWKQFTCTQCKAYKYGPPDESEASMLIQLGRALARL